MVYEDFSKHSILVSLLDNPTYCLEIEKLSQEKQATHYYQLYKTIQIFRKTTVVSDKLRLVTYIYEDIVKDHIAMRRQLRYKLSDVSCLCSHELGWIWYADEKVVDIMYELEAVALDKLQDVIAYSGPPRTIHRTRSTLSRMSVRWDNFKTNVKKRASMAFF
jgi:hypothetical protein